MKRSFVLGAIVSWVAFSGLFSALHSSAYASDKPRLDPVPIPSPPSGPLSICYLSTITYDWDFSTGTQGFYKVGCDPAFSPGLWEYGATTIVPDPPAALWGTVLNGDYYNSAGDGLCSPSFLVTEGTRYVDVLHYFLTEYGYDGCNVTVNGWPNETVITPQGGYTVPQISATSSYYAFCVDNEPGWTGDGGGWRWDCFDLSAFMGQWIHLVFDFGADESVTSSGWYIARILVGGTAPSTGACCSMTTGACSIISEAPCLEGGGDWHGAGTTCSPNPCPQPITYGGAEMGTRTNPEPWHNWFDARPGATLRLHVSPGELGGTVQWVDFYTCRDGVNWVYVGSDYDGAESRFNTIDPSVTATGDGWSLEIAVPALTAGQLFRMKAILHTTSVDRIATATSIADPVPPSLGTTSIRDWTVTERDTMGVSVEPNGMDLERIVVFRELMSDSFTKGIPGINQQYWGTQYCAPTAAAQCLKYFEAQGDYTVTGGLDDTQLSGALAEYMRTSQDDGTKPSDWWFGLQQWIAGHGDGYSVQLFMHFTAPGTHIWTSSDWLRLRNELERCQDTLVGLYWSGGGAHAMTLNVIRNTPLSNGRYMLGFMDPWTGQASQGDLDTNTGMVYNVTGAGGGRSAYLGATMLVSPHEPAVDQGGPGWAIYDATPTGEPPYFVPVVLPSEGNWFVHFIFVNGLGSAYRNTYAVVRNDHASGVRGETGVPALAFAFEAATPNPFAERTEFSFTLPAASKVRIAAYDAGGRLVRVLVDAETAAGAHSLAWDGRDDAGRALAAGVYFVRMEASGWSRTQRVTIAR